MKREAVQLLKFSGNEKGGQAFLKYHIWLEDWNLQIIKDKKKHRANMLMLHIDNEALKKLIGLENKYKKVMEKLDKYYGDNSKVIQACTVEIMSHPQV